MKTNLNKIKFISALLSLIMLLSILPFAVFAKEDKSKNVGNKSNLQTHATRNLTQKEVKKLSKTALREKIYSLIDTSKNGSGHHTSEYSELDIETKIYGDKIELTFPKFSGSYMIESVDEKGSIKKLKIVKGGETCTLSRHLFNEGKYLLMIFRAEDNTHFQLINYVGPINISEETVYYNNSKAFLQNEYYMEQLSKMTAEQRKLLLSATQNIQSDDAEIKATVKELIKNAKNDFEKTKAIYDFVINNVYYDYDSLNNNKKPPFDAKSVFKSKVAVCDGYASLFAAMLKAANIPAIKVGGYTIPYTSEINNDDIFKPQDGNHSWVSAYVDGRWLQFDPTHDSLNKISNGNKTTEKSKFENWGYFAINLQHLSSYRRFDGFNSEITAPDTKLVFPNGNNFSANPNIPLTFKAEVEPIWSDLTGLKYTFSPNIPEIKTVKNSSKIRTTATFKENGTYKISYINKVNGQPDQKLSEITINVSDKQLSVDGIEIDTLPQKTKYKVGESLNTKGLKLKVYYKDGSESVIDKGFNIIPPDMTPGENEVVVSYGARFAAYYITVYENTTTTTKKQTTTKKSDITIVTGDIDDPGGIDIPDPDATIDFNTTTKKSTTTNKTTTTKKTTTTTKKPASTTKATQNTTQKKPNKPTVKKISMYRLYNPNSGEHFYTKDMAEKNHLVSLGWKYEGIGWTAPSYSNTPVYRLYNPNAGEHHYTLDKKEKNNLVKVGWNYEGIGWYSDDAKGVPLYRQYNPNAFACNHNYTKSKVENDRLVSLGWKYEGIGWYGVK